MSFRAWAFFAMLLVEGFAAVPAAASSPATPLRAAKVSAIAETPPLPAIAFGGYIVVNRLSYPAGAELDVEAPGPVLLQVERGRLAVRFNPDGSEALLSGPPPALPISVTGDFTALLTDGDANYSSTGHIGPTRNGDAERLSVLEVLLIPAPRGTTPTAAESATPFP